jgi:hypothetical protein
MEGGVGMVVVRRFLANSILLDDGNLDVAGVSLTPTPRIWYDLSCSVDLMLQTPMMTAVCSGRRGGVMNADFCRNFLHLPDLLCAATNTCVLPIVMNRFRQSINEVGK